MFLAAKRDVVVRQSPHYQAVKQYLALGPLVLGTAGSLRDLLSSQASRTGDINICQLLNQNERIYPLFRNMKATQ